MSTDDVLARIDATIAEFDAVVDDDWATAGDAATWKADGSHQHDPPPWTRLDHGNVYLGLWSLAQERLTDSTIARAHARHLRYVDAGVLRRAWLVYLDAWREMLSALAEFGRRLGRALARALRRDRRPKINLADVEWYDLGREEWTTIGEASARLVPPWQEHAARIWPDVETSGLWRRTGRASSWSGTLTGTLQLRDEEQRE